VRFWTIEEARDYLPRMRELLACIREVVLAASRAPTNGHGPIGVADKVKAALEELERGDIVVRDVEQGLIDFHAQGSDGVVYFLCWRDAEPDLAWWHLPDEGFAGRKPLPRDPS
jgi:hypothetical protein